MKSYRRVQARNLLLALMLREFLSNYLIILLEMRIGSL